jgi:hypothetical protein
VITAMLTCKDLDGFVDQVCDLTRAMPPMARAAEATQLLDRLERVPGRFLMQWRAAAVADAHYLNGISLRTIATALDRSFQGVAGWVRDYGPSHYACLIKEGDGPVQVALFTVEGHQPTKTKIRQFRKAGRRIVPASLNIVDPDSPTGLVDGVDLDALWEELGG